MMGPRTRFFDQHW